jgi:hypothetical protein
MTEKNAPPKILLIGWELADWKLLHPLVDGGYLPNLDRLINRGVIADMSPASWRSVAIGGPEETAAGVPLWDAFARADRRGLVARWPGSHPARLFPAGGVFISDEFNRLPRPDAPLTPIIEPEDVRQELEALRVAANDLKSDDIRVLVPALDGLGEDDQPPINWLAQALADGMTTQKIALHLLETKPWDLAMIHYRAYGAICRQFLELSQVPGGAYAGVPAGAVMLADQMLGRVMELAGADTITCLCSAYGLFGKAVAVLAGPGIREDERLDEKDSQPASACDIAPTLCALAGVPIDDAVPGRVWNVRAG